MAKGKEMDKADTLSLLVEKLDQLEHSLRGNIPKSAILVIVRNLKRTAQEQVDYTYRTF